MVFVRNPIGIVQAEQLVSVLFAFTPWYTGLPGLCQSAVC
jgi:hypothetical protein